MARRFPRDMQERAARSLHRELAAAGIIPESARIVVQEGSRTYGRCWYVAVIPAGRSYHADIPQVGSLHSVTGDELREKMMAVVNALTAVRRIAEGDDYMVRRFHDLANAEAVAS